MTRNADDLAATSPTSHPATSGSDHLLFIFFARGREGGREGGRGGGRVRKGASAGQTSSTFETWAWRSHCLVHLAFIQKEPLDDLPARLLPAICQHCSASTNMCTPAPPAKARVHSSSKNGSKRCSAAVYICTGWVCTRELPSKRIDVHSGMHRYLGAVRIQKYAHFYLAAPQNVLWR